MEPYQIVQLLGPWSERDGLLYERLARAFEQVIRTGELPPGTRLPAERWLAQSLGRSRTTISAAYAMLADTGWVSSRRGSGTQVRNFSPEHSLSLRRQQLNLLAHGPVVNAYISDHTEAIDLSAGAPAWPTGVDPGLCALTPQDIAPALAEYGYKPQGVLALRQCIAEHYNQTGLSTTPEQILVTTGAQDALMLLATVLLQRGDTVILENPTFFGAIDAFRAAGARLVGVPIGATGLDLARLEELLSARSAQCVYLIPTFHNPTGQTLTGMQRQRVIRMIAEANVPLIEDLTLAFNVLDKKPPPPLASYARNETVITIGSLSKIIWAGLRIGWIRAPVPLIERLVRLKAVTDLGSSIISQVIAVRLLPRLAEVQRLRQHELRERRDVLLEALQHRLPSWRAQCPGGGLFVWAQFSDGDARDLAQDALHCGVIVTPGTTLSVDGTHTTWLRLPFLLPPAQLQTGIERLSTAWAQYTRRTDRMP